MDNSLVDVDVQANYVRVTLKGRALQLALSDEVRPDSSTARRSQTTGNLVITMPKARPIIRPHKQVELTSITNKKLIAISTTEKKENYLEVNDNDKMKKSMKFELANIVNHDGRKKKDDELGMRMRKESRENSPRFQDDPQVPPLE